MPTDSAPGTSGDLPRLQVIIASTRPGRGGLAVGNWFADAARRHGGFTVEVIDLLDVALPFLDEPNHPRLQKYEHSHTKAWSARIAAGDVYVLVTPEYNYGYPASLKNALDFLYVEWNDKPVGFVSYGGIAGGTRSVQQLRQVMVSLQMISVIESVNIPFFTQYIDEQRVFRSTEAQEKAARDMLDALVRWAVALKRIRDERRVT